MNLIDTHSHLYEPEFDADRGEALARAFDAGVGLLLLPAIDAASDERLFALCRHRPDRCLPMMGLHPTSVNDNPRWREELDRVARYLEEVASSYHTWYGKARVTPRADEEVTDLHRTRLWLNDATGQVLRNGLDLLGVSAPERM